MLLWKAKHKLIFRDFSAFQVLLKPSSLYLSTINMTPKKAASKSPTKHANTSPVKKSPTKKIVDGKINRLDR